jgi:hypothetical protein
VLGKHQRRITSFRVSNCVVIFLEIFVEGHWHERKKFATLKAYTLSGWKPFNHAQRTGLEFEKLTNNNIISLNMMLP